MSICIDLFFIFIIKFLLEPMMQSKRSMINLKLILRSYFCIVALSLIQWDVYAGESTKFDIFSKNKYFSHLKPIKTMFALFQLPKLNFFAILIIFWVKKYHNVFLLEKG